MENLESQLKIKTQPVELDWKDGVRKEGNLKLKSVLKKNNSNFEESNLNEKGSNLGTKFLEKGNKAVSNLEVSKNFENNENARKSNIKNQFESEESSSEEYEITINRKRRFEEVEGENSGDDLKQSLKKDLQESVIPASKFNLHKKRHTKRENRFRRKSGEREIDINKARRRLKNKRKAQASDDDEESDSSSSSDDTITTNERETLKKNFQDYLFKMTKDRLENGNTKEYLKEILVPLIKEEREQSKKETIELLREQGVIPAVSKGPVNYNDLNKDPFLEDEGFVKSDISGNTTPRRSPSSILGQESSRKNSFKMAKASSSQDIKLLGTPKRNSNIINLQNQIIKPNDEIQASQEYSQINNNKNQEEIKEKPSLHQEKENNLGLSLFSKSPEDNILAEMKNEGRTKSNALSTAIKSKNSNIESAKKTLFSWETKSGDSKVVSSEKPTSSSIFSKPESTKPNGEEKEKSSLSIFGPSKDTIEELKKSRSSNNSSPVFGESKNSNKSDKTVSKPVSLFAPKVAPIVESAEEDQSNTDDKEAKVPTVNSLFNPKPSLFKITENKQEEKPVEKLKVPTLDLGKDSKTNPFLNSLGSSKAPLNLFGSGATNPQPEPAKTSIHLFNSVPKPSGGSIFNTGASVSSSFPKLDNNTPTTNFISTGGECEDVGMGGVTPPTQSPMRQPVENEKLFPFQSKNPVNPSGSLFGGQGNSGASINPVGGSLFGGNQGIKQPFNLGTAKPDTKSLFSGEKPSIFAKGPNQGQPETVKTGWGEAPFGGNKKNNHKKDDGLFSDLKRP